MGVCEKENGLIVDPLLTVAGEIPAGRIAHVGEERTHAGDVDGVLVDELDFVVLLGNRVETVNGYGSERLPAFRDMKAQRGVVEAVDHK